MPRLRTTRRRCFSAGIISDAVIFVLCCGRWFFRDGFDWSDWPVDRLREAWRDPAVRERVYTLYRERKYPGLPFAEIAFGPEGVGGIVKINADLPAARAEYRRPWQAPVGDGHNLDTG